MIVPAGGFTNAIHPYLVNVTQERIRLQRLISDMEWEGLDCSKQKREWEQYRQLEKEGVIWDPTF